MHLKNTHVVAALLLLAACSSAPRFAPATGNDGKTLLDQPSPHAAPALTRTPSVLPAPRYAVPAVSAEGLSPQDGPRRSSSPRWAEGRTLLQGFFGAQLFQKIERTGGNNPPVDGSGESLSQIPTIGGGGQWKLGGDKVDFGLEGMLAFNWRANAAAFATGGGGAVVAVDVDVMLFELYGGPFVNVFLSDKLRVYGAVGPLMQWANYDQSGPSLDGSGSGFGVGYYTRAGIEFDVGSGTLLGVGVRWADSSVDLDGGQGKLDLEGLQVALTVSRWY